MKIGLIGYSGTGKSEVAKTLCRDFYYTNIKFSDALKGMLRELLLVQGADYAQIKEMIDGEYKEVPSKYLNGKTPRQAMQWLGTEWGRNLVHENFWIDVARRSGAPYERVVFDDVRFPNEREYIKAYRGVIVRVIRDSPMREASVHTSEQHIEDMSWDYRLYNNGTKEELKKAVHDLYRQIERERNEVLYRVAL